MPGRVNNDELGHRLQRAKNSLPAIQHFHTHFRDKNGEIFSHILVFLSSPIRYYLLVTHTIEAMEASHAKPNTVFRAPESSILPHIALYFIQVVALASPPFRGRRILFSFIIIALAVQAHLNPHFTNVVALAQPFTIGWSFYMATLAKLLFADEPGPEASYWRNGREAKEALGYAAFSWRKIVWAATLIFNQRGIGWNHQVKNVRSLPKQRRTTFLVYQAWQFGKCMLMADVLFELTRRLLFTSQDGNIGEVNSKYISLNHADWRWSFIRSLVFGATPYFMLSMQYAQFAFIGVFLGLTQPQVSARVLFW